MTANSSIGNSVGAVYLARSAEGLKAFQRFAESYCEHQAGLNHDLIVLYKGFAQRSELEAARQSFAGLPHVGIELDDIGFDIGSYFETCRRVQYDYMFFLNTHSQLLAPGWLANLYAHAQQESCGIVGTTGSYESLLDTVGFLENVIRASLTASGDLADRLAYYFDFLLPRFRPDWYSKTVPHGGGLHRLRRFFQGRIVATIPRLSSKGTALIWPGAPDIDTSQFASFPNPHVRSNGFMVRRSVLLSCDTHNIASKGDANVFESGKSGLTAQLRQSGLAAIVVGADGRGYDIEEWWRSGTFRQGKQHNLVVSDNHTRGFADMSEGARIAHMRMTWGDYLGSAPSDFPGSVADFAKAEKFPDLVRLQH